MGLVGTRRKKISSLPASLLLSWVQTCNVTAYRNTVSLHCGRDSWPRNLSKVGYAVTLRACSVRCPYLAVASKGWYGYGLGRSGRATWHVTTVRSSRLLYIHYASGSRNELGTPRCNARRIPLGHEARDESSDRNSVSCRSLATLRYAVTLQACKLISIQPLGRFWQDPEPSQATGMALARCILDKFLGVVCHCFPLPLDVPTFAARCLHVPNNASAPSSERWNCGREWRPVILPKWRLF
jgi:hypothetical protein